MMKHKCAPARPDAVETLFPAAVMGLPPDTINRIDMKIETTPPEANRGIRSANTYENRFQAFCCHSIPPNQWESHSFSLRSTASVDS